MDVLPLLKEKFIHLKDLSFDPAPLLKTPKEQFVFRFFRFPLRIKESLGKMV